MLLPLLLSASLQAAQGAQAPRVEVLPAEAELVVGETAVLEAVLRDGAGQPRSDVPMRWYTAQGDIVELTSDGRVRALRPGRAEIRVLALGSPGAAPGVTVIRVAALPPVALEAHTPVQVLALGTSVPLTVYGVDRAGERRVVPDATVRSASPVLRVDGLGRVHGVAPGKGSVEVRAGEAVAELEIEVIDEGPLSLALVRPSPTNVPVRTGDVLRMQVEARGRSGPVRVFPAWSLAGSGAQIEAEGREGVFVAEQPGRHRITALVGEGNSVSAVLEVEPRISEEMLAQVGRGAISTHHSGDMWVFEGVDRRDYVYVGTFMHDWMKVWDVTNPAQPQLTDSIQLDARRINDVKIHPNNRVGIVTREGASNRRNGIVMLDLATPAHPKVLAHYEETVTGGVHNVWIDGQNDLVYACHNGTSDLHILDISDPAAPREVGRWGLPKQAKTLHDVIVQDGYAFLSYWDDGVVILDVGAGTHGGTPRAPAFVSRYAYPIGNTHVAWRSGRYLFLGDEIFPDDWNADRPIEARGYIHVVDVSDIENPQEVAFYEVPEAGAHNVWVDDEKLYVGYYQAGLRVVDISGELRGDLYAQGREIASYRTTDAQTTVANWPMAWGAQIFKGRIYSSDLNSGLWITQLAPRSRPVS
ncbi:MAG: hypothetical protein R3E10_02845 [Gemmatimonadota bacterium]